MNVGDFAVTSAIASAVVSGIGYLFRNVITTRIAHSIKAKYDKELETHKADLKRDYDVQIEKLKASLAEQHFRFSHVFEQTAKVIGATYTSLLDLWTAVRAYCECDSDCNPDERQIRLESMEAMGERFTAYFYQNRLYIPKNTIVRIEQFFFMLKRQASKSAKKIKFSRHSPQNVDVINSFEDEIEKLDEQILETLKLLEADFQKLLGFPAEQDTEKRTDGTSAASK